MGMFDDLIPKPTPDKPKGQFDDLIAEGQKQKEIAAKTSGKDIFADLIPKKPQASGPAVQMAPPDSTAKVYWDATKKTFTDIAGEVKAGYGTKNPWELMKTESLPAHIVVQASKRRGDMREVAPVDVDENGDPIAAPANKSDATNPGVVADLKALGVTAKEHPGILIGSLVKSLASDPELLLPWLWEAIPEATAARVAQAARAMGASVDVAKAAEVGGRIGGRMTVGAGTSAAVEAGGQAATGDHDLGKLGTAAAEGAITSIPGRMAGKKVPQARVEPTSAHAEAVAAGVAEPHQPDLFTPAEAKEIAKVPEERLTAMNMSREALAQATKEDPITPQMIADVAKEPIRSPTDSRDRIVKAVKQAVVGGAIGAGVGYAVSNKTGRDELSGVEAGIAIGAGLPLLKARRYMGPDISALVNARNGQVRAVARHVYQFQNQVEKAVPVKADREALAEMIDRGVEPPAGTPEHEAWRNLKSYFADMGQIAKDAGIVESLRDNYISHIVEEDHSAKASFLQKLLGGGEGGGAPNKGGKSFGKERKYDTFEELQEALRDSGLKLKTKDASEIAGIYGNAVYKSVADARFKEALKATTAPDGMPIMVATDKAPPGFVRMGSPQLAGVAVHPDIAADVKFVFDHSEPNWVMRKMQQVTSIVKRITISTSLFHAKTLAEGFISAANGDLKTRVTPISAARAALKMYKEGGNNDAIDKLIKGGLMVGTPEDVAGHEVQHALDKIGDKLNERLPLKATGLGYAAKGLAKVDRAVEHFTFAFLQTGLKLNVGMSEFERLVGKGIDHERAARLASSFANDIFGSLDYYRVATDTDSHIMRKLGTASLNNSARRVLQLVMFAPDWTMSTFRTMAKAMPGGAVDPEMAQVHRRYMVKAAIYYFTAANAVNYALSGHSVFSNANPTRIDLGDGRTMQFAKHETEPLDWLRDPENTALNKLAFIPATARNLARAHQVAKDSHGRISEPTPVEDAESVLGTMAPISLQQFIQNGMEPESVLGALGFPIYGRTAEQKAEDKQKAREKRAAAQ